MQFKVLPDSTTAITDRRVTGICSVFGNVDDGCDIMMPGAFAKTLQEQAGRIKHLWSHTPWEPPIATITDIREVDRTSLPDKLLALYPEAIGGLQVEREYLTTERGSEVLAGIQAGAITEMSFGFDCIDGKSDIRVVDGEPVRIIREVRLWETSDVNWGMNPATQAASKGDGLTDEWPAFVLEGIVRRGADLKALLSTKQGRVLSAANLAKLTAAINALQEVLQAAEPPDDPALTDMGKALLMRIEIAKRQMLVWE